MSLLERIEALRTKQTHDFQKVQERFQTVESVLGAIPSSSQPPLDIDSGGNFATVSLCFSAREATLEALLQAYPAQPCVAVGDDKRTLKPKRYVRKDEETTSVLPIHPVISKPGKTGLGEGTVIWWTELANQVVEVSLIGESRPFPAEDAQFYDSQPISIAGDYCRFYLRKLSEPKSSPVKLSQWQSDFFHSRPGQLLADKERLAIVVLRDAMLRKLERHLRGLSVLDLDQKKVEQMVKTALENRKTMGVSLPVERYDEVLAHVATFMSTMYQAFEESQKQMRIVQDWFEKRFEPFGAWAGNNLFAIDTLERITHEARAATGFSVNVSGDTSKEGVTLLVEPDEMYHDMLKHLSFEILLPSGTDKQALRPQDINVSYM